MLVAHSFDLWQKDTFFAAAEEVQQSADIMESAYRTWEKERRALLSENSGELCRELQTALGTTKWQLEEFEKAIRLSYRNRDDDFTMARHRQFVDAIEFQISRVETALLRESCSEQGNQPLSWVNLNEEECDDLAAFISGIPGSTQIMKEECAKLGASINSSFQENTCLKKKGCNTTEGISYYTKGPAVLAGDMDSEYIFDMEATEIRETKDDINCQSDRTSSMRRTWSSPGIGTFKIVIRDEDVQKNALVSITEATPKDKGSKPFFLKKSWGDHHQAKGGILSYSQLKRVTWINKILGQVGGCQRKLQAPMHSKLSFVGYKLALMLTLFLIGMLLVYLN